jgi:hypothetical protein
MPGFFLHVGATVFCQHGGGATPLNPFERVSVSGRAIVTVATQYSIAACGLSGSGTPPCATGHFTTGAARVRAGGMLVATTTGHSVCVPTATPMTPTLSQTRVVAQ